MKRIRKIGLVIIIASFICLGLSANTYAIISCNITIDQNVEAVEEQTFTLEVKSSNINASRGILALEATLNYDKSKLTYVEMNGGRGWVDPSYNETNGKLVTDRGSFMKENGTVFTITFKVNKGATGSTVINFSNIGIANGTEENTVPSVSTTVRLLAKSINNPNINNTQNTNQGSNINNGNSNNGNNQGTTNNGWVSNNNTNNQNTNINENTNTQNPNENMNLEERPEENNEPINNITNNEENKVEKPEIKKVNLIRKTQKDSPLLLILTFIAIILGIVILILLCIYKIAIDKTKKISSGENESKPKSK